MTWLLSLALLLAAGGDAPNPDQSFRLESGDFRWVPFTVRQTPTGVACRVEVKEGGPSVHLELLPMSEFRLFDRGREHETMAITSDAKKSEFRRVIDTRGQYAVVVVNKRGAPPVLVSLHLETSLNPNDNEVARTLPPARRLAVLLVSFVFFLSTASWASLKLIRAMRSS